MTNGDWSLQILRPTPAGGASADARAGGSQRASGGAFHGLLGRELGLSDSTGHGQPPSRAPLVGRLGRQDAAGDGKILGVTGQNRDPSAGLTRGAWNPLGGGQTLRTEQGITAGQPEPESDDTTASLRRLLTRLHELVQDSDGAAPGAGSSGSGDTSEGLALLTQALAGASGTMARSENPRGAYGQGTLLGRRGEGPDGNAQDPTSMSRSLEGLLQLVEAGPETSSHIELNPEGLRSFGRALAQRLSQLAQGFEPGSASAGAGRHEGLAGSSALLQRLPEGVTSLLEGVEKASQKGIVPEPAVEGLRALFQGFSSEVVRLRQEGPAGQANPVAETADRSNTPAFATRLPAEQLQHDDAWQRQNLIRNFISDAIVGRQEVDSAHNRNGQDLSQALSMTKSEAGAESTSGALLRTPTPHLGMFSAQGGSVSASVPSGNVPTAQASLSSPVMQLSTPPGQAGWDQAVGERVVWMANREVQSAELRLNPPQMGKMDVRVTVDNDQAHVSFVVNSGTVREAVESAMPRLREMFAQQGLSLGDVDVSEHSSHDETSEQGPTGYQTEGSGATGNDAGDDAGDEGPRDDAQPLGYGLVNDYA